MACHLHPILGTWDAVTTCTQVTVFFPLGVRILLVTPQVERKKKIGCVFIVKIMLRKVTKCMCILDVLASISMSERT